MGIVTASIGQTSPTVNKLLTLYGEVGPAIGPSHTLFLDATVRYNVLINNITTEDVHVFFNNGHAVYQQLEREINVTNEE